jgi:hypothetical protein
MSVYNKARVANMDSGKHAKSLASALQQGDQPKHTMGREDVGNALRQHGNYPGSKGSAKKSLGRALMQSSK